MKSRLLNTFVVLFFTLLGFSSGYLFAQSPWAPLPVFGPAATTPEEAQETFAPFWEVWRLVHTRYFDQPVDDELLAEGAIDGMLAVLDDPNTRYLSPEDEAAARQSMAGEIQGIGAEVEEVDGEITIVAPIEGSPAEAAGLRPGDILREADGQELTGLDVFTAAQLVRGPAGTTVRLLIQRGDELFEVEIERDVIEIASVRSEMLEEGVAYLRLSRFGDRTPQELEDALRSLMAEDPTGLILDLRRNPGGGLDTAVDVADQFLAEGIVLVERFGNGRENVFESSDSGLAEEVPLVVLIDEGSASAAEVLAGAIRDRERGALIGQTTFGKGTVQTWQQLSNGGGVRITIARWLTPDEVWVHGDGLEPDYVVPLPQTEDTEELEDTQLQAAIDYLLGEPVTGTASESEE